MRKILMALVMCLVPMMGNAGLNSEVECLAKNIYHESRGEPDVGKEAVAWVTLNRMKHPQYPSTICDVVYDRKQFSWTNNGEKPIREMEQWEESIDIARDVLIEFIIQGDDPTDGAIMFHTKRIKPKWVKSYKKTLDVGHHIFYKD